MLVGGEALLRKVDVLVTKETSVPSYVANAPMACVALGAARALADYSHLRRMIPGL